MIEYGNARIGALRGRLLSPADLRRLEEAADPAELLGLLERTDDWRETAREVGTLGTNPAATVEAAIERHRAARLGLLPRCYQDGTARLVEALVLPLDLERLLAVLRRRWAGESADTIGPTLVRGALLSTADLGRIARAPSPADAILLGGRLRVLLEPDAGLVAAALRSGATRDAAEAMLVDAVDRARAARSMGRGADAALVRRILEEERRGRRAAGTDLRTAGAAAATLVERSGTVARLAALARASRRDPLGIGVVAGYVAAVELQAMRLRAALSRVVVGWSDELLARLSGAAG